MMSLQSEEVVPVDVLRPALMACPGCQGVLRVAVAQCPQCGYDAALCVQRHPFAAPPLDPVVDPAQQLSEAAVRTFTAEAEKFRARYPQISLHVCVAPLGDGADVREFGFWLLNAAPVRSEEEAARRPWTVLLVLNTAGHEASLTVGYQVDPLLSDEVLTAALALGREDFRDGDWGRGISRVIGGLFHELAVRHRVLRPWLRRWQRSEDATSLSAEDTIPASLAAAPSVHTTTTHDQRW